MTKCRLAVVGNINIDFVLTTEKLPRRGENRVAESFSLVPGGKGANQAVAAARLGAQVTMLGRVGNDAFGEQLLESLEQEGVDVSRVQRDQREHTGTALVMVEQEGGNAIVSALGANMGCQPESLVGVLQPLLEESDAVLVQLGVPLQTVEAIIGKAAAAERKAFFDPTPLRSGLPTNWTRAYAVTPNETEARPLCRTRVRTVEDAERACRRILKKGPSVAVVKMGEQGVVVGHGDEVRHFPAYQVEAVDSTGAGDAFAAAFAVRHSEGAEVWEATQFANCAGALAASRFGAQPSLPHREEVEKAFRDYKTGAGGE